MRDRFAAFRDRPLSEQERPLLLLAVAAVLTTSALLFALTRPTAHPPRRVTGVHARRETPVARTVLAAPSPPVARVCERFLAGYLAYLYGHAPASAIRDTTTGLRRSLTANPPRVSPAMRAAHPRLLSLTSRQAAKGQVLVSALVNDGGLIDYRIGLVLTVSGGRLRVSALEAD